MNETNEQIRDIFENTKNQQIRGNFKDRKAQKGEAINPHPSIKSFEELEFKDDFIFGVIMRNPKYCKTFLETILGISISDIEYPKTQQTIDITANAKSVRLDVYVEAEQNTVYNIEMQVTLNKNLPKRSRYYQGMIDLNILEKGEDYKNLKRSYIIFICTFDLFGKGTMNDICPEMKRLLDYIDGQEASDEFTNELASAVKSIKDNERWRVEYMTLEMRYRELLEQGLEQGLQQGIEQGIAQTAINMLKADKLSVEEISSYTGLTSEHVLELKKGLFE